MHRPLAILLCALPVVAPAQRTAALELLALTMQGSYSSAEQAKADTSYVDAELEIKRIWGKRKDGVWFYVEQAVATSKQKPYRQRVYHVQQVDDSTFTSDIHIIKGGEALIGAYSDPVKLDALRPNSLGLLEGCTITLHRHGSIYVGATNGRSCANARSGAVYATSEVSFFSDHMVSWDRGYDASDKQVWGATKGGYIFVKRRR